MAFDDDDREAILARRNRFIAAALASIAGASMIAAGCDRKAPQEPDPTNVADPQPCLKQMPPPVDASATPDVRPDAGAANEPGSSNTARPDAAPTPCLRIVPSSRAR